MSDTTHVAAPDTRRGLKRRVFVIEDHALMRRSLVEAIEREPDLKVCGQAEDAPEALTAIASMQPDLVLTDLQLKSSSGLEVIRFLRANSPQLPIIAITMFNERRNERLARTAGVSDFVSKQDGPKKLIAVIHGLLKPYQDGELGEVGINE